MKYECLLGVASIQMLVTLIYGMTVWYLERSYKECDDKIIDFSTTTIGDYTVELELNDEKVK